MASVSKNFQDLITFYRNSSATYVNSAGYITNTPVVNYLSNSNQFDLVTWTKAGSFVQTNLLLYSEQFDQWSLGAGTTVATNATISPNGTLTADRVSYATGGAADFLRKTATMTVGVTYTVSVYAQNTGTSPTFYFDIGNGSVVASPVQTTTSTWQRFSYTFVFAGVNQWVDLEASTPGSINFWGAQLVQGSVPGDYVATTSAALPVLYPDYNGALRARKLCEDTSVVTQHRVLQQVVVGTASTQFTSVIKVKAGERSAVRFINYDGTSNFAFMYVNLATGAIHSSGVNGTATNASFSVTSLANGWYLLAITCDIPSANRQSYLNISNPIGTTDYTGDGSSGVYIADAGIAPGINTSYWDNLTSSFSYTPRFDYDPVTLAARGLLVEESRTNLLYNSNNFAAGDWTKSFASVTAGQTLSPDGEINGWLLTSLGSGGRVEQNQTATATIHTFSAYTKAGNVSSVTVLLYNVTTSTIIAQGDIDLSTGVATTAIGVCVSVASIAGWWRVAVTNSSGITIGNLIRGYIYTGLSSAVIGSTIYAYGAQLEPGAFATSYIPTTSSQITRAADVANVNTLSPWFNTPTGTIYVEADLYNPSSLGVTNAVTIGDGGSTNVHRVLSYNGKIGGNTIVATVTTADLQPYTYTVNTPFKFAYAYATNDFAAVGNGGTVLTDPAGAVPTGLNVLNIGNLSGVLWSGHIRRITYYPQRLSNAQLQSITA